MLDDFQKLAVRVYAWQPLVVVIGALALLLAIAVLIDSSRGRDDSLFIPALLVSGWCALLLIFCRLFIEVPGQPEHKAGLLHRLGIRFRRSLLFLLALGFCLLTVSLAVVGFKLLSL